MFRTEATTNQRDWVVAQRRKGEQPVTHTAEREANLYASEIAERAEGKPLQSVKLGPNGSLRARRTEVLGLQERLRRRRLPTQC